MGKSNNCRSATKNRSAEVQKGERQKFKQGMKGMGVHRSKMPKMKCSMQEAKGATQGQKCKLAKVQDGKRAKGQKRDKAKSANVQKCTRA